MIAKAGTSVNKGTIRLQKNNRTTNIGPAICKLQKQAQGSPARLLLSEYINFVQLRNFITLIFITGNRCKII